LKFLHEVLHFYSIWNCYASIFFPRMKTLKLILECIAFGMRINFTKSYLSRSLNTP